MIGSPASAANATINDPAVIDAWDIAQVQFEIWLCLFILIFVFFIHSILFEKFIDITAIMAFAISLILTPLSISIAFVKTEVLLNGTGVIVQPVVYVVHSFGLIGLMIAIDGILLFNVYRTLGAIALQKIENRNSMKRR